MSWFYISFATETKFLGATVLQANDPQHAVQVATSRHHNPGGEAAILLIPVDPATQPDLAFMIDRLASEDELIASGATKAKDLSPELRDALEDHATLICEGCNQ